jgi:RNA polymerase sigma-70 factor (ECF subfamily)
LTDEEQHLIKLMIHYQAGQVEAFEEFYRLVKPKLYQYLLINSLDRQWAEELLQDTFFQIHRSRRTYIPGKPVTPWIFAIAHYVYLNDRKVRIRRGSREEPIENHLFDLPVPAEIEAAVEVGSIKNALAKLLPAQREAVLLHHYWGFSFKEIGATLGIRAGTAKLRAHRGLQKLREHLKLHVVTQTPAGTNRSVDAHNP